MYRKQICVWFFIIYFVIICSHTHQGALLLHIASGYIRHYKVKSYRHLNKDHLNMITMIFSHFPHNVEYVPEIVIFHQSVNIRQTSQFQLDKICCLSNSKTAVLWEGLSFLILPSECTTEINTVITVSAFGLELFSSLESGFLGVLQLQSTV